eukprot:gnl/TRDRNA2_/TRDRNA2_174938_c5_seq1.p1 gnl/TRDRNA2_/TRDRNA2_174938_c5~~gnl/TRDRNA2_/TRDRNA2_174938_c5_seq1.p1  ORF type:complete len:1261 (-),score=369.85 gnl/TRDRNA2_/TRDRNA2_174938_c5_seq1:302-4027(-)
MADTTAKRQKSRIVKEDAGGIANTLTNIVKQRLAADTASAEPGQDGALRGRRQPQAAEKENSGPIPAPKGKKAKLDQEPQRPATSGNVAGERTVEQIYQKKTQLEHILLRPDSYVGSTERQSAEHWIMDDSTNKMVKKTLQYVPALYKIFDEILVNAADNLVRDPENMDYIKVDIDAEAGVISVTNNGKGLPVVMHKEHKCYVPELVFGHLLTSDNYNDNDAKTVGGRNGYGAKLANVFSLEFTIETCDGSKKYIQNFEKNMSVKHPPKITDVRGKPAQYTKVTFKPDVAKFGMTKLDTDIVSLLTKRVYDCAGSTLEKCQVFFNGEKLDVRNFKDYTDLYLLSRQGVPQIFEVCSPRWEVCVSLTEAGFQQVSFVNSICTIRGGTHVNHVTDQVVEAIIEKVKIAAKEKVKGGVDVKPHHVKNHLWVFVKCLIENPAFDSQTKETLMTKQSKFGSRCELSDKFLSEVSNSGVVDLILTWALAKTKVDLGKKLKTNTGKVSRLMGVPKLEDANDAGGKNSADCTLILTEGDSAKALAVAGLSVVGRDKFGVFPLRGKVLNVRDATFKQMMANEEIQNLMKIVGLDMNKEYEADENGQVNGLRYGSIMIMTDQDADGSHIKGLLINLIHSWWPSLARIPGFLKEFFTPIVKATKGRSQQISFYTIPEYEKWKQDHENGKGYKLKYYKGLGTSTSKEAKEYFSAIAQHTLKYKYEGIPDDTAIDLAFNKKRADDRKEWINSYHEGSLVDHTKDEVSYKDFIDKELVLFSKYNVVRAIPSLVDGFKPSQRKILFGCFKRKLKNDVKVAQLVGYVSEHAAYHHGEAALTETIIGMAQDFVGSNNINLLVPQGQFGTRLQGGKDAASARYIYTRLAPITRIIFKESDDNVLEYMDEEGLSIEPKWYCPIIPMLLVNGADGIGTGWSTSVPAYNPRDIIKNLRSFVSGEDLIDLHPWYNGFTGSIEEAKENGKFEVCGTVVAKGGNKVDITELPVKKWTQDYREFLEEQLKTGDKKSKGLLEDYTEQHTERTVHFELQLSEEGMEYLEEDDEEESTQEALVKALKVRTSVSTNNMILFDSEGKIRKYESANDILVEFACVRLRVYNQRKEFLLARLTKECEILSAKARFIKLVVNGTIVIKRRKIADLIKELQQRGFKALREVKGKEDGEKKEDAEEEEEDDDVDDDEEQVEGQGEAAEGSSSSAKAAHTKQVKDYEYLVGMPISSLTAEKNRRAHEAERSEDEGAQ